MNRFLSFLESFLWGALLAVVVFLFVCPSGNGPGKCPNKDCDCTPCVCSPCDCEKCDCDKCPCK